MIKRIGSEWSGEETVAACRLRKRNLRPVSLPAACMLAEPLRSASADFRLVQPMGGRRAQEGRRESRVWGFLLLFHSLCASAVPPPPAGQARQRAAPSRGSRPLRPGSLLPDAALAVPGWWLRVFPHLLRNRSPARNSRHVNAETHFSISRWALVDVESCQGSWCSNWLWKGKKKFAR